MEFTDSPFTMMNFENLIMDGDLKELIVHVNRGQNWIIMAKTTGY